MTNQLTAHSRENTVLHWDDGCDLYSHCLDCPFSVCAFDDGLQARAEACTLVLGGPDAVRKLYHEGMKMRSLVKETHLGPGTLRKRILWK